MENLEFPKGLRTSLYSHLLNNTHIDQRSYPIENVHQELLNTATELKKLLAYRKKFYEDAKVSVINLMCVAHSKILDANGCVLIKVQGHILPIKVSEGCKIENNFNAYDYSINKVNNKQEIYKSSEDDCKLHKLLHLYQELKKRYEYKIGNRVHLKTFQGMYKIIAMDHTHATISCNKWKTLGKPPVKVRLEDIKCLAGKYNNLHMSW